MNAPPVSTRPHWTSSISPEETLKRRDKFRKIDWRPPNHKPSTKKVVAWAKTVWSRYVTRCSHLYLRGVTVQMSDAGVPRYCEHIGADADQHLLDSGPADFEAWIDWMIRTTKKKTHETISQMWKWLCQAYSILARQPMDCLTTERVRRGRPPFVR